MIISEIIKYPSHKKIQKKNEKHPQGNKASKRNQSKIKNPNIVYFINKSKKVLNNYDTKSTKQRETSTNLKSNGVILVLSLYLSLCDVLEVGVWGYQEMNSKREERK